MAPALCQALHRAGTPASVRSQCACAAPRSTTPATARAPGTAGCRAAAAAARDWKTRRNTTAKSPRDWASRAQPHGRHDIVGVGAELFGRERNRARHARGGRSCFEMAARRERRENGERLIVGFERANDRIPPPGPQHGEDEFGGMALGKHRAGLPGSGVSASRLSWAKVQNWPEARSRSATSLRLSWATFNQRSKSIHTFLSHPRFALQARS